jgi:hypothetical protein
MDALPVCAAYRFVKDGHVATSVLVEQYAYCGRVIWVWEALPNPAFNLVRIQ